MKNINPFLKKLRKILSQKSQHIKWDESGRSVEISDNTEAVMALLEKAGFKSKKNSLLIVNFTRQLVYYDFKQAEETEETGGTFWYHPFFQRDCMDNLVHMNRDTANNTKRKRPTDLGKNESQCNKRQMNMHLVNKLDDESYPKVSSSDILTSGEWDALRVEDGKLVLD